ncbi:MAG: TIGR02253 family HAD-type hydrolase [Elusimicrobiales bacterium]|nr:TIGR02253 family HAD-type hydrolase [Elusimicrobiales bacterium]
MIEAVIFDFDNTLMDFMKMKKAAVEAAVDYMIDAGLKIEKTQMIEKIFKVYWEEGIEDQNIFDKVLLREFGEIDYKILAAGIVGYRKAKEAYMVLYPHVRLTLSHLMRMGIRLGVVSDAPRLPVWLRIVSLGLHHYFEKVVTFDDTNERKPSPKPFLKILEDLRVKPQNAVMVGDWAERDIVGAKNIGMITAWAKYGNQFDTKHSGADWELNDIYDLVEIVKKINFGS